MIRAWLISVIRQALRTERAPVSDRRSSGFYKLMRLNSAAIRVSEGEAMDSAAQKEGVELSALALWLARR